MSSESSTNLQQSKEACEHDDGSEDAVDQERGAAAQSKTAAGGRQRGKLSRNFKGEGAGRKFDENLPHLGGEGGGAL